VPTDGWIVACGDEARVLREAEGLKARVVRYGLGQDNAWQAVAVRLNTRGGNDFAVEHEHARIGDFSLGVPGTHNVLNALAALAVAERVGIEPRRAGETLARFQGVARRFQVKGEIRGVVVVDDYAHHPSEIRATLRAARGRYPDRALWAVFQPHTFSRTQALLDDFARAFGEADHVIVTEIYAAREKDSLGVSSRDILARMCHPDARYAPNLHAAVAMLRAVRGPAVIVTLGAGDVYHVGEEWMRAG
jgi:UDP-N-acetylmuramate--alanine ligase